MYILNDTLYFPPVSEAHSSGVLALGGDLSRERLLLAYKSGIFPWFEDGEPITWWAPEERMVLFLETYKPSKSLRNLLNKNLFSVTFNQNFERVIFNCKSISRNGQQGTWITDEMEQAYVDLHKNGFAQSVEVWQDQELVGGLYGVDLGTMFCGESMFSKVSNASKVAFHFLVHYLKDKQYQLLDCQVYNEYLDSLGCVEINRDDYMAILRVI